MYSFFRQNFWLVAAGLIFLLLALFLMFLTSKPTPKNNLNTQDVTEVSIREAVFKAEIVKTPAARARGLSGRDSIAKDAAMLFIFDKPGIYSFWMKDMRFPIDIIWLRDKKIVYITKNVLPPDDGTPDSKLLRYDPRIEADIVLEVNAGVADKFGLSLGDVLVINR